MTKDLDDLDAVRMIADALSKFEKKDQDRIIRWAMEKVGLTTQVVKPTKPVECTGTPQELPVSQAPVEADLSLTDIKTFINEKNPTSDNQRAATVAYYYHFVAPEEEQKETIGAEDLQNACRLAGLTRLKNPISTLRNAHHAGLLDKSSERGQYSINSVGENLVAMTLPRATGTKSVLTKKKVKRKKVPKKVHKKKRKKK